VSFWDQFFIILGSVLVGLILSLVVINVITIIQRRRRFPSQKRDRMTANQVLPKLITILTAIKTKLSGQKDKLGELSGNHKKPESVNIKVGVAPAQNQPPVKSGKKVEVVSVVAEVPKAQNQPPIKSGKKVGGVSVAAEVPKAQNQPLKSDILKELEINLAIATAPWASKLTPFQTTFWDDGDHLRVEPLLANHQEEIAQVYIDIRLANSIVWLSNEVGHRSADLDESYRQLCNKIAERLRKVITSLGDIK